MPKYRNPNAGLFTGYWLTPDLTKKVRRIKPSEYPELYRLWRKHRDIRLGVFPIGIRGGALSRGGTRAAATTSPAEGNPLSTTQADERLSVR